MPLTSEARRHAHTRLQHRSAFGWDFHYAAISDVGQRREENEDFYLLYPERNLYVLADGMGGHAAGEVAARLASETLGAYFEEQELPETLPDPDPLHPLPDHLERAMKLANRSVFEEGSSHSGKRGMGTTLVALTFHRDFAYWAHVGDSRLYIYRDDSLGVLTRDHSLLEDAIVSQGFSHQEAQDFRRAFPYRNVLTRAIGSRDEVDVDVAGMPLNDGDIYLLTSDGVHDVIGPSTIADIITTHRPDFATAARTLVDQTNAAGGPDNITALFVQSSRIR